MEHATSLDRKSLNTLHHKEPSLDKAMNEIVDEMNEDEKATMRSDRE